MEHGPGSHVTLPQVKLDNITGEGAVVVEGSVIDHVACANPVVRKLVGVGETALFENLQAAKLQEIIPVIEVSDINFILVRFWIFHPCSLIPAIGVVSYWLRDGGQSVLTLLRFP